MTRISKPSLFQTASGNSKLLAYLILLLMLCLMAPQVMARAVATNLQIWEAYAVQGNHVVSIQRPTSEDFTGDEQAKLSALNALAHELETVLGVTNQVGVSLTDPGQVQGIVSLLVSFQSVTTWKVLDDQTGLEVGTYPRVDPIEGAPPTLGWLVLPATIGGGTGGGQASCALVYGPWTDSPPPQSDTSGCTETQNQDVVIRQRNRYNRCVLNGVILSCNFESMEQETQTMSVAVSTTCGGDGCAINQATGSYYGYTDPYYYGAFDPQSCQSCQDENGGSGLNSIHLSIPVGLGHMGGKKGWLRVNQERPGRHLFTPAILENFAAQGTEIVRAPDYSLRQLASADRILNIEVASPAKFRVATYPRDPAVKPGADGTYPVSGTPIRVQEFENPQGDVDPGSLLYRNILGGRPQETLYTWNAELNVWSMTKGGGLQKEMLSTTIDPKSGDRIEERIVSDAQGNHPRKTVVRWHSFSFGERIISRVTDPKGANLTQTLDYYTDVNDAGRYGKLKTWVKEDGSWTQFDYAADGSSSQVVTPWKDSPVGSPPEQARVVRSENLTLKPEHPDYHSIHHLDCSTTSVLGVPVARSFSYRASTPAGGRVHVTEKAGSAGAAFGDAGNLRMVEHYAPSIPGDPASGRLVHRVSEDGRTDLYSYRVGDYLGLDGSPGDFKEQFDGAFLEVIHVQIPAGQDAPAVGRSTRNVSIQDVRGNALYEREFVCVGIADKPQWVETAWTAHAYDAYGKLLRTRTAMGVIAEYRYSPCCSRLEWQRDQDGTETRKDYDVMGRLFRSTRELPGREPMVTTSTLDPHGATLAEVVQAGTLVQQTTRTYDGAGRLVSQTAPGGYITRQAYPTPQTRETILPSGGTRIETAYLDTKPHQVRGTAVVRQDHDYGVDTDRQQLWQETRTGGGSDSRGQKQFTNALGQNVRTESPTTDAAIITAEFRYDDHGHPIAKTRPGSPTHLSFTDEATGTMTEGEDLNGDGKLDPSQDRLTRQASTVEERNGHWFAVQRIESTTGSKEGQMKLVSLRRKRITALSEVNADGQAILAESESEDASGHIVRQLTLLDVSAGRRIERNEDNQARRTSQRVIQAGLLAESSEQEGSNPARKITFAYDAFGRLIAQKDQATGALTQRQLDPATGQVLNETAPSGPVTAYTYAAPGQPGAGQVASKTLIDKAAPQGAANRELRTHYAYNARGEKLAEWGGSVYPVAHAYDRFGQMIELRTLRSTETPKTQSLVALGKVFASEEASVTRWHRDPSTGKLLFKEDADATGPSYTYDAQGRLTGRTWARGAETHHTYDDQGHLIAKHYNNAGVLPQAPVTITRDPFGRPLTMADGFASYRYGYDNEGHLVEEYTQPNDPALPAWTLKRTYDPSNRPTGHQLLLHPSANGARNMENGQALQSVAYAYDPQGRLSTLTDENTQSNRESKWTYAYSAQFPKQVETLIGPAFITKNELDPQRGHLLSKEQKMMNAQVLARYAYTVNALGQREQVSATGTAHPQPHRWDWDYNERGEVVVANLKPQASGLQPIEYTYAYDTIGNRRETTQESMNAPIVKTSYNANALNQYSSIEHPASNIKPSYDADGNLTSNGAHRYLWDAENRLLEVQDSQGLPKVRYTYDAKHRRVRTDVTKADGTPSSSTLHLYEGWNCIAEVEVMSGSAPITRTYVWGLDLSNTPQGAGGVGGLLAVRAPTRVSLDLFPAYDGNGNITAYVKIDGSVAATFNYDTFGNTLQSNIKRSEFVALCRYGFSTKPVEPVTGFLYYGYRYYDPDTGRWPSRDPIGERDSVNLLVFLSNDPTYSVDRLGLEMSTNKFIDWYENGAGVTYNIVTQGELSQLQAMLTPEMPDIYDKAWESIRSAAKGLCQCVSLSSDAVFSTTRFSRFSNRGNRMTIDLTSRMFWLGDTTLFWGVEGELTADCEVKTYSFTGDILFSLRDAGADPLDLGFELPLCMPYDIVADWKENFPATGVLQ